MNKVVCFTGPLPKRLYGYDHDSYIPLVNTIESHVANLYNKGYTRFISGGAQGVDQLAFWAVNRLKNKGYAVENIIYVPFKGQDSRWRDMGLFSKHEYNLMQSMANKVKVINEHVDCSNYSSVSQAMLTRNRAMVNDSDIIFGVYFDNSWRNNDKAIDPGTAYTLRYGTEQKKPCMVLNVNTLKLI